MMLKYDKENPVNNLHAIVIFKTVDDRMWTMETIRWNFADGSSKSLFRPRLISDEENIPSNITTFESEADAASWLDDIPPDADMKFLGVQVYHATTRMVCLQPNACFRFATPGEKMLARAYRAFHKLYYSDRWDPYLIDNESANALWERCRDEFMFVPGMSPQYTTAATQDEFDVYVTDVAGKAGPITATNETMNGNPHGGLTIGKGFEINWQKGPLGRGKDRQEPNGAFVEDVIAAAKYRIEFYQSSKFESKFNEMALIHLNLALKMLDMRTAEREIREVEGTHEV